MKKRITLSILLTSVVVLGGIISREPLQNNEGTLAIYVEDEKVENIPSNSENYVFDHAVCTVGGEVTDEVEITWDDEVWAPVIKNLKDHSTKCNLYFVEGEADFNSSILACNESSNAAQCFLDNASLNTEELVLDETVDNNLRYIGADPNNYVTFNNESWRIIGVMNNIDDGTGVQESRLKIIRNSSIGNYSWSNTYGNNNWSISEMQEVLNSGAYWNRTTGNCPYGNNNFTSCNFSTNGMSDDGKRFIKEAKWNLGGISQRNANSLLANDFYSAERGDDVYELNDVSWIGNIAFLYVSDYAYATSGDETFNRESCLNTVLYNWSGSSSCYLNNWLYSPTTSKWTLNVPSNSSLNAFLIDTFDAFTLYSPVSSYAVYPVTYLRADVKITSGTGSASDPYILSIE